MIFTIATEDLKDRLEDTVEDDDITEPPQKILQVFFANKSMKDVSEEEFEIFSLPMPNIDFYPSAICMGDEDDGGEIVFNTIDEAISLFWQTAWSDQLYFESGEDEKWENATIENVTDIQWWDSMQSMIVPLEDFIPDIL